MKKLLLLLSLGVLLFSCESDDDTNYDALYGNWYFSGINAEAITDSPGVKAAVNSELRIIKKDNANGRIEFSSKFTDYYNNILDADYEIRDNEIIIENKKLPYTINGNTITIISDKTEEYKNKYPAENITKVIYHWVYKK